MSEPLASVVIRTKDEAASIGRLIDILRRQTVADALELIVVDSGSTDATVGIVREHGIDPIEMPARSFSFGRSLNLGCAAASAPILIALSAHAFPLDDEWAARMLQAFEAERVACACGEPHGPDGSSLTEVVLQTFETAQQNPFWGYSNAAGGFRASLWRERPWREDLPGTEDREWAWHWMRRGWMVRVDPALVVDHDHSHDDLRSVFVRSRREWVGYSMYLDLERRSAAEMASRWWRERDGHDSAARARLSPWRAARLVGEWAGRRQTAKASG
jgi:rhamnosyltransferase